MQPLIQHPHALLFRAALNHHHPPANADTEDCPDQGAGPYA